MLDVKYHQKFWRKNYAQLFIWPVLKFWKIPILTNSDSNKFQFWQIPILTNSNFIKKWKKTDSDKFQFWQIPILTNSNFFKKWEKTDSDKFRSPSRSDEELNDAHTS